MELILATSSLFSSDNATELLFSKKALIAASLISSKSVSCGMYFLVLFKSLEECPFS